MSERQMVVDYLRQLADRYERHGSGRGASFRVLANAVNAGAHVRMAEQVRREECRVAALQHLIVRV